MQQNLMQAELQLLPSTRWLTSGHLPVYHIAPINRSNQHQLQQKLPPYCGYQTTRRNQREHRQDDGGESRHTGSK